MMMDRQITGPSRPTVVRLADLRQQLGVTQLVAAERSGLQPSQISRVESGPLLRVHVRTVHAIVSALGARLIMVADCGPHGRYVLQLVDELWADRSW